MLDIPASQVRLHAQTQAASHAEQFVAAQAVSTVICPVCDAVYAPALAQVSFLQASPEMLEAAFMSMCHFCFRCRRPACPQCWDGVHGVCGDCVRETQLSFRSEAAPLNGLLFQPLQRQAQSQQEVAAALLTCVKSGRFVQTETQTAPTAAARTTEDSIPAQQPDVHEKMEGGPHNALLVLPMPEVSQRVTEKVATTQTLQADTENRTIAQTGKAEVGEDEDVRPYAVVRVLRVIERVLTVLALVLLAAIIALVIVAQASDSANTLILRMLHIDIRAEVAYLIHLIQQLRQ